MNNPEALHWGLMLARTPIRLLKNFRLLHCAHPWTLQHTVKYASFLAISSALHLNVFDQPVKTTFVPNSVSQSHRLFNSDILDRLTH
jgi:hypothetical protein